MPAYSPILIYFIRRTEGDNPDRDDCLRIEKLGENNLRLTYTERSVDGPIIDTALITYQKLAHYLCRLFWILSIDEDPFQSVQTMIPSYPTFRLSAEALKTNMNTVLDMVMTTCWHWPAMSRAAPPPLRSVGGGGGGGAGTAASVVAEDLPPFVGSP